MVRVSVDTNKGNTKYLVAVLSLGGRRSCQHSYMKITVSWRLSKEKVRRNAVIFLVRKVDYLPMTEQY